MPKALPISNATVLALMRQLETHAAVQSERQQLANISTSRSELDSYVSCACWRRQINGDRREAKGRPMRFTRKCWRGRAR